jgi:hypothetical protein
MPAESTDRIEISNNTFGGSVGWYRVVPGVTVANNILAEPFGLVAGSVADGQRDMTVKWHVANNSYLKHEGKDVLPLSPFDMKEPPRWLSIRPEDADFLRLAPECEAASGGVGGVWPFYQGALEAGPLPPGGDWFSRLRRRGREMLADRPRVPDPVSIEEPLSFEDWLKTRTRILRVGEKDADFTSIQKAFEAIKPGEAIELIDKAPYREWVDVADVPSDTGMFSRCGSVIDLSAWPRGKPTIGLHLRNLRNFRLANLGLIFHVPEKGIGLRLEVGSHLVVERCSIRMKLDGSNAKAYTMETVWRKVENQAPVGSIFIRDCTLVTTNVLMQGSQGHGKFGFLRNFVYDSRNRPLTLYDMDCMTTVIRKNVVWSGSSTGAQIVLEDLATPQNQIEIGANFLHQVPLVFVGKVPQGKVVIANNVLPIEPRIAPEASAKASATIASEEWIIAGNAYLSDPKRDLGYLDRSIFALRVNSKEFLGAEPKEPNFARPRPESKLAILGLGGGWGRHVGPLPGGPAPPEGDWYSRLHQRRHDIAP